MVRHREIKAEQLQDGADQAFGLAQCQAEHGTQRQSRLDRQAGVARLTAPTGAGLSFPGLDRFSRKPYGQAAPGTQARIVGRPVGDPVPLFRNVVPPVPVGFERHGRRPSVIEGSPKHQPTRSRPHRRPVQQSAYERDLRPAVIQRKVTNGFRAMWAAQGEADVRTVVDTARLAPNTSVCGTILQTITA